MGRHRHRVVIGPTHLARTMAAMEHQQAVGIHQTRTPVHPGTHGIAEPAATPAAAGQAEVLLQRAAVTAAEPVVVVRAAEAEAAQAERGAGTRTQL